VVAMAMVTPSSARDHYGSRRLDSRQKLGMAGQDHATKHGSPCDGV
jgi:hypothetical protein